MKKNFLKALNKVPAIAAASLAILASIPSVANAATTLSTQSNQAENKQLIAQSCGNTEIRLINGQSQSWGRGSSWKTCNGYTFGLQNDGNLVLYSRTAWLWSTNTAGRGNAIALQRDGNVVLYDINWKPIWATNTVGNSGAFLALQTDGNLVVYNSSGRPLWATNTVQKSPTTSSSYASNLEKFVNSFVGTNSISRLDTPDYKGQCVSLVARYLQEVYFTGSQKTTRIYLGDGKNTAREVASQFPQFFEKTTSDGLPKRGAVVSFPNIGGIYGHTAIVMKSEQLPNGQRRFWIMDSNGDNKAPNTQVKEYYWDWIDVSTGLSTSGKKYGNNIYWANPR